MTKKPTFQIERDKISTFNVKVTVMASHKAGIKLRWFVGYGRWPPEWHFFIRKPLANKILNYSRAGKLSGGSETVRWRDDVTFKWTDIILKGFWGGKQQNLIKVQIDSAEYVMPGDAQQNSRENLSKSKEKSFLKLSTTVRRMNLTSKHTNATLNQLNCKDTSDSRRCHGDRNKFPQKSKIWVKPRNIRRKLGWQ